MSYFPTLGRLAAIDFDTVRIGIAITDPSRNFASPLENYNRSDLRGDEHWMQDKIAKACRMNHEVGDGFSVEQRWPTPMLDSAMWKDIVTLPGIYVITWTEAAYEGRGEPDQRCLVTNQSWLARMRIFDSAPNFLRYSYAAVKPLMPAPTTTRS